MPGWKKGSCTYEKKERFCMATGVSNVLSCNEPLANIKIFVSQGTLELRRSFGGSPTKKNSRSATKRREADQERSRR
jgi:hypothetical protein